MHHEVHFINSNSTVPRCLIYLKVIIMLSAIQSIGAYHQPRLIIHRSMQCRRKRVRLRNAMCDVLYEHHLPTVFKTFWEADHSNHSATTKSSLRSPAVSTIQGALSVHPLEMQPILFHVIAASMLTIVHAVLVMYNLQIIFFLLFPVEAQPLRYHILEAGDPVLRT